MKARKITALLMASLMAISMAACGSSPAEDSGEASGDQEETAADQEETSGDSQETPEDSQESGGDSDFAGETLVIGVWGGTWREAFDEACVKPFEEKYGVTVEEEEMGDNIVAQTIAQVNQDIEGIDVACGGGAADFGQYLGVKGAVKELDYSRIGNAEGISDDAKCDYAVGMYICAEAFTYDNDAFPEIPEGAAGFFDTENYPGDRSIRGFAGSGVLEQALLADGVAFEDMYPLDLDRAFAKLDTIKDSLTKFWSSGSEIVQTINDKEAVAGEYWFAHVNRAKDAGADVTMTYQDAAKFADSFSIVTNTKKEDLAYAFIDFCLDDQVQANLCNLLGYAPIKESTLQYLDEDKQEELSCLYQSYEEGGTFWAQTEYWGDHFEEVSERYQLWIAK